MKDSGGENMPRLLHLVNREFQKTDDGDEMSLLWETAVPSCQPIL
jgi:hypothetical protein